MLRYKLLIFLLTPIIIGYTIIRAVKFKDKRYLQQRLGFIKALNHKQNKPVWIHAASVGEVIAVIPLVQRIQNEYSGTPILITTNTATGAEIVKTQLSSLPQVEHCYMPIDWSWAMTKIIKYIQPRTIFVVETEIWPNLFNSCFSNNIPVIIINARLSHRTTSAKPWLIHIYKNTLSNVSKILARSEEDYNSYLKLGAQKSRLKLVGNIKYAANNATNLKPILLKRPYVLAASTHDDEEKQLSLIWMKLIENKVITNEILVIVPRHPERSHRIEQQLKNSGANLAIRSKDENISDLTQIYIADTVGELKHFMLNAKFVFMGGSLIPHGGQNIIEPAQLGKAIIFGQHMFNFKYESQQLLDNDAAIQVKTTDALYEQFVLLLQDNNKIDQLSKAARQVMQNQGNTILDQYMMELKPYIVNDNTIS
ncbi:MAG: 3-deoxy-D-manno-octulosonic acid transferase [Gammaproteobacteria bacterium]